MSAAWSGHSPVLGALPGVDVNSLAAMSPTGRQHDAEVAMPAVGNCLSDGHRLLILKNTHWCHISPFGPE